MYIYTRRYRLQFRDSKSFQKLSRKPNARKNHVEKTIVKSNPVLLETEIRITRRFVIVS